MRQIQYNHERHYDKNGMKARGGKTTVMEKITFEEFQKADVDDVFVLHVGVAICSDEDNYCKKTGRDLAKSRMTPMHLLVTSKGETWIRLYSAEVDTHFILMKSSVTNDINFVDVI